MSQAMASPSIYISSNGAIIPTHLESEENALRLQNARLQSKLETLTCFITRLALCRSLFPSDASSSTWLYAVAVMTALSFKEVVFLARLGSPMWINEKLDLNEYYSMFFPWYAKNSPGFVHEASRASAIIPYDASSLVAILMDLECWPKIFPSIIAAVSTELHHQEFDMINMDLMPLISPSIQTRNVELLRCSKHIENDTWVIADISLYFSSYARHFRPNFMRFPSGYVVEHITNGVSRVTIIDHWVYKEKDVRNLVNPNSGFGAQRWLTALQRHLYNICFSSFGLRISSLNPICETNLLNLSAHMVYLFCTGVYGTPGQKWKRLRTMRHLVNNIRIFTRESRDPRGVPFVIASATGLARMHAKPKAIFDLINHGRKDIWECLRSAGDMKEVIRMTRSFNPGNEVTLFSIEGNGPKKWCVIQESYFEASATMIIHTCIEASSLTAVVNGRDMSRIQLLPCGFTIMPCGLEESIVLAGCQVTIDQTAVTNPNHLVDCLERMIYRFLTNVQNTISARLNLFMAFAFF